MKRAASLLLALCLCLCAPALACKRDGANGAPSATGSGSSASAPSAPPSTSASSGYASADGRYRIAFPSGAEIRERVRKVNGADTHVADVTYDNDFFGVLYRDYPHAMVVDKQQNLLVEAQSAAITALEAKVDSETAGARNGDPTRDFTFHTDVSAKKHTEQYGRMLLVLHGDRVYQIAVTTKNRAHLERPRVGAFVDSFTVTP